MNEYWFNSSINSNLLDESNIFVNGVNYLWSTTSQSGRMDVQNNITHELGHALNLKDLYGDTDGEKTMYGYSSAGEIKQRTIETEDIAGTVYLYPQSYSFTLSSSFEFGPQNNGQIVVKNITQATNSISYNLPLSTTIYYGSSFELTTPSQQEINGIDYRFCAWIDGNTSNPRSYNPTGNATLNAWYKAHLRSSNSAATGTNGQKKIVFANNLFHLTYESAGEIWYTYSSDNGATWATELRVSDGSGLNMFPAIDAEKFSGSGNMLKVGIVWLKNIWPDATEYYLSY